jgi:hypothetical protein
MQTMRTPIRKSVKARLDQPGQQGGWSYPSDGLGKGSQSLARAAGTPIASYRLDGGTPHSAQPPLERSYSVMEIRGFNVNEKSDGARMLLTNPLNPSTF